MRAFLCRKTERVRGWSDWKKKKASWRPSVYKGDCKKAGDFLLSNLGTMGNGFKLKENRFDIKKKDIFLQ